MKSIFCFRIYKI